MPALKLGIRELVEFCCRGGDLGYDDSPGIRAMDGLQTHQKIQRRYNALASAEVRVAMALEVDGQAVELGGRIDLLFEKENPPRIEEIKTVYRHLDEDDPNASKLDVHWAQLKCYGACYTREHGLDAINLCLNQVGLFTRDEHRHERLFAAAELQRFVEETLRRYLEWQRLVDEQRAAMRAQARALEFPFPSFRHQQRAFAAEVYRAIRDGGRLTVEAPTGSGKTLSTLFPAQKALGEELCDQVIYLSAKVSGQQQALDALDLMGVDASCLVIQAKARSCPCNDSADEVDDDGRCKRCIGFFDRLPQARRQLLERRRLDVAQIQASSNAFGLCPFELALQMLPWVDFVVCDFNYVFDPLVQLSYFRGDERRKLLLIDELHNLVDRARDMYSASIARNQVGQALDAGNSKPVEAALKSMQRALDQAVRAQADDETIGDELPRDMLRACQRFGEKLGFDIFGNKHVAAATLEFSKAVFRFQNIGLLYAEHHRTRAAKPVVRREIKLLCLNAFAYLRDIYPLFHAVCGFSATLTPTGYFQQALGLADDCRGIVLESGFPAGHLGVCVATYIDTRYREREAHIDAICDAIVASYRARPGNYLVFFSAYHFMRQVHERFAERYADIEAHLQQRDAGEAEQRDFLQHFFTGEDQLGFVIMGGRFAEGIDYRGDALIGAIVVGAGLPQVNSEQQLIQQDFESMGMDGFDYAFRFPGLIRVKQSAGRVIRGEQDRGVVVLLERRFAQPANAQYLPRWWRPQHCNDLPALQRALHEFWQSQDQ